MKILSAPDRTREELRALIGGDLGTATGRSDLVRLALRPQLREARRAASCSGARCCHPAESGCFDGTLRMWTNLDIILNAALASHRGRRAMRRRVGTSLRRSLAAGLAGKVVDNFPQT